MPNPGHEPPASSKDPNQDLKDMSGLSAFKIKKESQSLEQGLCKTSDHIQIKIKIPKPSQDPPASKKTQNKDLKDMDVTFKINLTRPKFRTGVYQKPVSISKSRSRSQTLVRNLQHSPKPQIRT